MQFYMSEQEVIFIVINAVSVMADLEAEMKLKNKLIKYDHYVQWYELYKKFNRRLSGNGLKYGEAKDPKRLLIEITNANDKQISILDGEKKSASK